MKTEQHKRDFIRLRAEGFSFDKIAEKIKVSKPTLLHWERFHSEDISNLKAEAQEVFMKEQKLTLLHRAEILSMLRNRLSSELEQRDLSDLPTQKLIELLLKVDSTLDSTLPAVKYFTEAETKNRQKLDAWEML